MNATHDQMNAEYQVKQITAQLVGHRIVRAVRDNEGSFGFEMENGATVWIDRDPEGNGPGWMTIEQGRR
jgi:hypothetical protein